MSETKRFRVGDLPSKQRLRRLLFYRFGAIAFEPNFPIALATHEAGKITPNLQAEVEASGLDVLKDVVGLFDQIGNLGPGAFDSPRFGIYQAYLDYLLIRRRPPTIGELRRREWEGRELPALSAEEKRKDPEELSRYLEKRFGDAVSLKRKSRGQLPMDSSLLRTRVAEMGLVLLEGEALRSYRRLYRELGGYQNPPTLEHFARASIKDNVIGRHLSSGRLLRDEPLEALIEVMAAPFDLHPFERWVQSFEMNLRALPARLKTEAGLSAEDRFRTQALYDLFFRLGVEMEILIEGSQPTAGLFPSLEGQRAIRQVFLRLASEANEIPSFEEFWLSGEESLSLLREFGELNESHLEMLKELVGAVGGRAKDEPAAIPIARIAKSIPSLGFLADAFESAHRVRETMIFWHALQDLSLHKKEGESTADFLKFAPPT